MRSVVEKTRSVLLILLLQCGLCVAVVNAQNTQSKPLPTPRTPDVSADKSSPNDDRSPLTTFEAEWRAKRAIRIAEKEHEENLKRATELGQLGQDLKATVKTRTILEREDTKKIDRLEKLAKKIRGEAGGGDDDVQIVNAPSDVPSAINQIADAAELLSKDVQKTPRQVVSASVIDRANVLLQLVKILRGFTKRI